MEQGFVDILKTLVKEQGKQALLDGAKARAFLGDYTKGEYKKESRLILQAIDIAAVQAIDTVTDLPSCKRQLVDRLHEEHFTALYIAADVIDTLAFVLRGDTSKTVVPGKGYNPNVAPLPPPPLPRVSPQPPASPSTPASKKNPVERFLMDIGFEDADYPGYGIPLAGSLLLSAVVAGLIAYLTNLMFHGTGLPVFLVCVVISFMAFFLTHVKLRIIMSVVAGIGLIIGIYNLTTSSPTDTPTSSETAVTQKAEPAQAPKQTQPPSLDTRYKEAKAFFDKEQYNRAAPLLQTLAAEGYAPAQGLLGNCFFQGNGVTQDRNTAVEWWRKSADQGDASGQYGIGYAYFRGQGLPKDYNKAIEWLTKAIEQGHLQATYNLGLLYLEQDKLNEAWDWLNKAAKQGHAGAKNEINNNYHLMLDR